MSFAIETFISSPIRNVFIITGFLRKQIRFQSTNVIEKVKDKSQKATKMSGTARVKTCSSKVTNLACVAATLLRCSGLVKFPPTGRDKKGYPPFGNESRTYGRNEHIAFYINDILGEVTAEYLKDPPDGDKGKARKQVSSHLQVLKKMFDGRPRCESPCFDRML
jgi:hypothetical protein